MAMAMLERHLRENVEAWVRFLRGPPENLPSKLAAVGVLTCAAAMSGVAATSPPAGGAVLIRHRVWMGTLAATFFAGLCAIWAALWVDADARRRRIPGQIILFASMFPLVVAIVLSGSDDPDLIFNIVFNALA